MPHEERAMTQTPPAISIRRIVLMVPGLQLDEPIGFPSEALPPFGVVLQNAAPAALTVSAMSTSDESAKTENRTSILLNVVCTRLCTTREPK